MVAEAKISKSKYLTIRLLSVLDRDRQNTISH